MTGPLIPGRPGMSLRGLGGVGPRRIDRGYAPPGSPVAPGAAQQIFRGRQVIISGSAGSLGLFEYTGIPRRGNPPVAWATPPGVTTDPFGNALAVSGGFAASGGTGIVQVNGAAVLFALAGAVLGGAAVMTAPIPASTGVPGLLLTSPSDVVSVTNDSQAALGLVGRAATGGAGPFIWLGSNQAGSSNILSIPVMVVGGQLSYAFGGVPGGALVPETFHNATPSGTNTLGNPPLRVKMLSENNQAFLNGTINAATTFPAGFQILATLPAGPYSPTFNQLVQCFTGAGVAVPGGVNTSDQVFVTLPATGVSSLTFSGPYPTN